MTINEYVDLVKKLTDICYRQESQTTAVRVIGIIRKLQLLLADSKLHGTTDIVLTTRSKLCRAMKSRFDDNSPVWKCVYVIDSTPTIENYMSYAQAIKLAEADKC